MQSLARTVPRPIPRSVSDWFDEITLAIADARGREPIATITGQRITPALMSFITSKRSTSGWENSSVN
jgi:hypothetical protein